jgi:hypothetical protein
MTGKKLWLIAGGVVLLGGIYYYLYSDWFTRESIQMYHRIGERGALMRRGRSGGAGPGNVVFFGFDHKHKLTSVKVVPLADLKTNKYPHAIWELVSDSNSIPLKGFAYGMPIPGMRPTVKGARPDPLEPGVTYRLQIQSGSLKGEHDFSTTANSPEGN